MVLLTTPAVISPLRTIALQQVRQLRHLSRNPPRASLRVSSLAADRRGLSCFRRKGQRRALL